MEVYVRFYTWLERMGWARIEEETPPLKYGRLYSRELSDEPGSHEYIRFGIDEEINRWVAASWYDNPENEEYVDIRGIQLAEMNAIRLEMELIRDYYGLNRLNKGW